jgi:hypothetical protein
MPQMKQMALDLARAAAGRDRSIAGRMFTALEEPFQVHAVQDARLIARAELSMHIDEPRICADAVGALEPHVPWTLPFLILRRDCYARGRHAATPAAERDLARFAAGEGQPLSSLVSLAPR